MRSITLFLILLLTLAACAAPVSQAAAPTITPRAQAVEAGLTNRVVLAAGHYQLVMFYSPI